MTEKIISKQNDSRKKSLTEAFFNSFGIGFPIAYCVGVLILPSSVEWITKDPFVASIFITLVFTSVSFTRVYIIRRFFTKLGYDDNFIKLAMKLCQRGASIIKSKEWRTNEKNPKTSQH